MATGIKDKVAIIGMGCTRFGERWDVGAEELMVEAFTECIQETRESIVRDIQAAWLGTCMDEVNVGEERSAAFDDIAPSVHTCDRVGKFLRQRH